MKSKTKPKYPVITAANRRLTFDHTGAVVTAFDNGTHGDIQVTAKELDGIVSRSNYLAATKRVAYPSVVIGGHDVEMIEETGSQGKAGDVFIGCQLIPRATLLKFHEASLAIRRKTRKARK